MLKSFGEKEEKKINTIDYFREIPRKDATPAEAAYLFHFNKTRLNTESVQEEAVSSTILNLCLKKKISLKVAADDKVMVTIIDDSADDLKQDEKAIYKLLKDVAKRDKEFEIRELNKYAKTHYNEYSNSINKLVNEARNSLYKLQLIDKAEEREYAKYKNADIKLKATKNVYEWAIVNYLMTYIPFFKIAVLKVFGSSFYLTIASILIALLPLVLVKLYLYKLQSRFQNKIAVLTENGMDEKAKWKALAHYMKDYSLLKERKVEELVLWEGFLVYATAFGIADEVIEQMKADYPEVFVKENWDDEKMLRDYPVIYFVYNPFYVHTSTLPISSLNSSVANAYKTSVAEIAAHAASSGGGGGRRFLWRRRWPVVAGRTEWEEDSFSLKKQK